MAGGSSARDRVAVETEQPREVVKTAYGRSERFEHCRRFREDWPSYLAGDSRDPEADRLFDPPRS